MKFEGEDSKYVVANIINIFGDIFYYFTADSTTYYSRKNYSIDVESYINELFKGFFQYSFLGIYHSSELYHCPKRENVQSEDLKMNL